MVDLTAKKRAKIKKSEFGLPEQRSYPMPDKAHAKNAKARAAQMFKSGKLTKPELDKITRKANRVLGAGTPAAAKKKGLETAKTMAKKNAPPKSKKVVSAAKRYGTRTVKKGRTVAKKK